MEQINIISINESYSVSQNQLLGIA